MQQRKPRFGVHTNCLQEMREFLHVLCSNETKYEEERILLQVYNGLSLHSIADQKEAGRKHEYAEVMDGHVLRGMCDSMNDLLLSIGMTQDLIDLAPPTVQTLASIPEDDPFQQGIQAFIKQRNEDKDGCGKLRDAFDDDFSQAEFGDMVVNMSQLACLRYLPPTVTCIS